MLYFLSLSFFFFFSFWGNPWDTVNKIYNVLNHSQSILWGFRLRRRQKNNLNRFLQLFKFSIISLRMARKLFFSFSFIYLGTGLNKKPFLRIVLFVALKTFLSSTLNRPTKKKKNDEQLSTKTKDCLGLFTPKYFVPFFFFLNQFTSVWVRTVIEQVDHLKTTLISK